MSLRSTTTNLPQTDLDRIQTFLVCAFNALLQKKLRKVEMRALNIVERGDGKHCLKPATKQEHINCKCASLEKKK